MMPPMSFASRVTRCPRARDSDRAGEITAQFQDVAPEVREVLAGTAGCSPFLYGLMLQEADWLSPALAEPPNAVLPKILAPLPICTLTELKPALRQAKRRVALYTALADLGGVWRLDDVTEALTEFADLAVDLAAKALVGQQIDLDRLPGQGQDDKAQAAGLTILAMGKMGAHELNFSSDIDLISLFDDGRYDAADLADARAVLIRVTRGLTGMLSDLTSDGYVFRTDLRLRPDPSVTPVCLWMAAAESYYESVGRTWERAAHIKARPAGGDKAAGRAYLERLRPFIWRKHLDFAAIQDAHDMRLRIREHKGLRAKIVLEGHNLKLGVGGIREIEFFTQTRQIIAGGRDAGLRQRATLPALAALSQKGWVPDELAAALAEDYAVLRQTEHRIQMINDAQTHDLPRNPDGIGTIAALSDRDEREFRADLLDRLHRVANQTEGFFAPGIGRTGGPEISNSARAMVDRWRNYPALRSARAGQIFERLKPGILARLQKAASPDEAMGQFDRFLAGLPAGVQVFSLFESNPQLIDLIVDIAATAPHLAGYLGRNAEVFDAVIGGDFFAPWPGRDALADNADAVLERSGDYEAKLGALRRWQKEWHFRIGVHQLRGLIDATEAGAQYADLADAVLRSLWPVVVDNFGEKHGEPPGNGAVVLGMGSLGSERLTAASDLDMIVIYDAEGIEDSAGPRPLPTRVYYSRLTQALLTAISAPMAEGRLYEVDMRLRPSGRKGPVATSLSSFITYQLHEAWTWERLALTRARHITGQATLGERVKAFLLELLAMPSEPESVLGDVVEMRERIASAKLAKGDFEAKLGPGRMQDIELFAQTAALISGQSERYVLGQLSAAISINWVSEEGCAALVRSYTLMWRLQSAARLLTGDVLNLDVIGRGGIDFLLRETGTADRDALADQLITVSAEAAAVIEHALGNPPVRG